MLRPSFVVRPSFPCVVAVGMVCVGCAPAPAPVKPAASQGQKATHDDHHHGHGHEDHAHPETLAAGLAELEGIATAVKTHLDAGARDKADKAVHMVGHLVEDLRGLLPKENLSAEAQAAAGKALDEIFDAFDTLDVALHAAEGKSKPPAEVHASVAEKINAAIKTLKGLKEGP
jgi:hypothetical protein